MVHNLDGSSDSFAHMWSELDKLLCLGHLFASISVSHMKLIKKRPVFLQACAMCSELPSNISTMLCTNSRTRSLRKIQYAIYAYLPYATIRFWIDG